METIVALATSRGIGAIHIIRLSGNDAYEIISKLAKSKIKKEANKIQHVQLFNENHEILDDVLLMKFVAPKSFTGEDLIEINCHGSEIVANKIIDALIYFGAKQAQNGEFSKRALLNNKMNAIQLFAMNNLIKSTNDLSIKFSLNTLLNNQVKTLEQEEENFFHIIGRIEVLIDYPEFNDDIEEPITNNFLINYFEHLIKIFDNLIHDAKIMIPFYEGINVAIVGVTNAGKSSLLNKLINSQKAIVSDIAGTTRDIVEAYINLDNRIIKLQDTAGIHESNDYIENIGINKSKDAIHNADLILFVVDGSNNQNYKQEQEIYELIKEKNHLIIINKSDLSLNTKWEGIKISTKDDSYKEIFSEIIKSLEKKESKELINSYTLQDKTQLELALSIKNSLLEVKQILLNQLSFDLIIDDLHRILNKFQELIGKKTDLNFIDRLFANFCVGK
ncbi:MAG: tRNA uridine-5-carboxymethylaminomethyl(34) synthesis GTPase MnmE [Mycoplasmataceae bacterium]|nr:tRNA uridine-5-carboxymethylaminomethyl(34) synthesis GTPase MnmE [Mycoplasmataceae bacterium]